MLLMWYPNMAREYDLFGGRHFFAADIPWQLSSSYTTRLYETQGAGMLNAYQMLSESWILFLEHGNVV